MVKGFLNTTYSTQIIEFTVIGKNYSYTKGDILYLMSDRDCNDWDEYYVENIDKIEYLTIYGIPQSRYVAGVGLIRESIKRDVYRVHYSMKPILHDGEMPTCCCTYMDITDLPLKMRDLRIKSIIE